MGMSACVEMAMYQVTTAGLASRLTSAQPQRRICTQTAPVNAALAMTFQAQPTMSKPLLLACYAWHPPLVSDLLVVHYGGRQVA